MSSNTRKRPALGKGLSALLENEKTDITSESSSKNDLVGSIAMIDIANIEANPFNPRTNFEKEALEELSKSIVTHGIIQPLTLRKLGRGKFQLISGERRFKASQLAGLSEVPAYIRIANDQTMLEMALVENIQREDLNAIEVALSYQRLIDECSLTQEKLSKKISKSRSSITNHLRLLKLPAPIQAGVRDNTISMGHARALVAVKDEATQMEIFERTVAENLSVRDIENWIKGDKQENKPKVKNTSSKKSPKISASQNTFKEEFSEQLSTKVSIKKSSNGGGNIVLPFNSENDLNRIIELLNK